MKGILVGGIFVAWATAALWGSLRQPAVARALLGGLFVSMGLVNVLAVLSDPLAYTDLYGDRAWIPWYRDVLHGAVADHAVLIVAPVALAQVAGGLLLLVRRHERAALTGMVVFLVATVPLGPEVAVNLVFAAGAVVLLRSHVLDRAVSPRRPGVADDPVPATRERTAR